MSGVAYLRATKKVLSRLPGPNLPETEPDETALGDWYVNRVVVVQQLSAETLRARLGPGHGQRRHRE
jgi:hypothetical protein